MVECQTQVVVCRSGPFQLNLITALLEKFVGLFSLMFLLCVMQHALLCVSAAKRQKLSDSSSNVNSQSPASSGDVDGRSSQIPPGMFQSVQCQLSLLPSVG